ncbi:MAG TPA: C4-dicarboxylate ABC transporter substrate-binding protein [Gammaproteobacteria bacterium]|nr:C4-dicarboxylate ABC transporter substrate-binding protein [Gammaproteobacteria bacterium]HRF43844.1 TAXI family TRAP transporter solute-binding subunit [Candidatus Competibacteraceae bacterium]
MKKLAITTLTATALLLGAGGVNAAEEKYVTIGTGGQTGVYYVVGQSICKLVNREQSKHGIKCTAPSTGGSVANLNAIRAGEQDMGVAQSDQQYKALKGEGDFEAAGPFAELRAVFAVHPESFTVVARKDSGIKTFDDLKGKRVNIGNPGSGQRATMDALMQEKGWDTGVFQLASELKAAEQSQALCDNKIDAMVYVVGHPNGSIQEAASSCDAVVIPVTGPEVDKLVKTYPYYAVSTIPGKMYPGSDNDIKTFGVTATFVSSTKTPDDTIYVVVKAVFDNFDRFKKLHPAFANLEPAHMLKDGLSAPLHDGAVKYYKEKGWLK